MTFAITTAAEAPLKEGYSFHPPAVATLIIDIFFGVLVGAVGALALTHTYNPSVHHAIGFINKMGPIGGWICVSVPTAGFIADAIAMVVQKKRGNL